MYSRSFSVRKIINLSPTYTPTAVPVMEQICKEDYLSFTNLTATPFVFAIGETSDEATQKCVISGTNRALYIPGSTSFGWVDLWYTLNNATKINCAMYYAFSTLSTGLTTDAQLLIGRLK